MKTKKINSKRGQFKKFAAKDHAFLKKIVGGEEGDHATAKKVDW